MDLDTIDLDRLSQLIQIVKDGGLSEFRLGPLALRFQPPLPEPGTVTPLRPSIDSPGKNVPNPYDRALGGELPRAWPKAE